MRNFIANSIHVLPAFIIKEMHLTMDCYEICMSYISFVCLFHNTFYNFMNMNSYLHYSMSQKVNALWIRIQRTIAYVLLHTLLWYNSYEEYFDLCPREKDNRKIINQFNELMQRPLNIKYFSDKHINNFLSYLFTYCAINRFFVVSSWHSKIYNEIVHKIYDTRTCNKRLSLKFCGSW